MQHGRNHDERLQKARPPRSNHPLADDEAALEAALLTSRRHHVMPPRSEHALPESAETPAETAAAPSSAPELSSTPDEEAGTKG